MSNPDILMFHYGDLLSGIFVKIFRPKIKVILFTHIKKDTHFLILLLQELLFFFPMSCGLTLY